MEIHLTKQSEAILRELVRAYDNPQDSSVRQSGISEANLARRAGFDPEEPNFAHFVAQERELLSREFATSRASGNLLPTPSGLDLGRWLLRPRWRKLVDYFQGDLRAVTVALITTLVTTLALRLLGWT